MAIIKLRKKFLVFAHVKLSTLSILSGIIGYKTVYSTVSLVGSGAFNIFLSSRNV